MRRRWLGVVLIGVVMLLPGAPPVAVAARGAMSTAAGFLHPGILVNRNQLYFVRTKIAQRAEPWSSAFAAAKASRYAVDGYTPHPVPEAQCGPGITQTGCQAQVDDADAAYTQALMWYYTQQVHYASTAVRILDAWATTLRAETGPDRSLHAAWAAETFTRAAEIIRYTYSGWTSGEIDRFSALLTGVLLPLIVNGAPWQNSNWELSMADGVINIGVFTDDRSVFDRGVAMWRARVPAYIYLHTDGPIPIAPPGGAYRTSTEINCLWLWTSGPAYTACRTASPPVPMATFYDGQTQEACRDYLHVGMGMAALVNAAETARFQGVNLYAEQPTRIRAGLEFAAGLLNGKPPPPDLCAFSATPHAFALTPTPTWEIGYDEFATRAGLAMPNTLALIESIRPTGVYKHMAWETLTSAGTGRAG